MKHLVLLAAAGLMLATAMPAFAAGSSDTDSLSPKNTPPPNTASSAPQDDSSSAPPDNTAPPDTTTPPPSDDGPTGDNVTARDPQSVLTALSNLGYPGKLEKMDSGRTSISVRIAGLKTYIDFYDCDDNLADCYTLLFNVALDLKKGTTMDKANEWNSKQITGRVWLDDNKDPTLDFAFSTFNGVPADTFEQNVKLWDKKISDLKEFFDF